MEFAFLDLLNSDWHDYRGSGQVEDRLERPGFVEDFLQTWGLPRPTRVGPTEREMLRSLRTLLRRMVDALAAGSQLAPRDIAEFNRLLAAAPEAPRLAKVGDGYELRRIPLQTGWESVVAAIAAPFAQVLAEFDPQRLKICENPDCGWVFYDESRSRTRRWCEDGTCGNLMKVRRFRARARKQKK
ncbi:MAG: CGNR zinc finger domain-containing protein [Symbiobacteriia bacterium]